MPLVLPWCRLLQVVLVLEEGVVHQRPRKERPELLLHPVQPVLDASAAPTHP